MLMNARRLYRVLTTAILGLGLAQQAYAYTCQQNITCAYCTTTCKDGQRCCVECSCQQCTCFCKDGSTCFS
jgi:hypothetical protein